MKKTALTVILVMTIIFVGSGCALRADGYGIKPSQVEPVPYNETSIQNFTPTQTSTLENKMDTMIAELHNLASAIRGNGKTAPAPAKKAAKKPKPGVFSQAKKEPAIPATPMKVQAQKAMEVKGVTKAEFRRLKARVDQLSQTAIIHAVQLREQAGKYQIFRIGTFAGGDSNLKYNKMEDQVDELTLLIGEKNLTYLRVIGYTNADGHRNNLTLSGERAKAVLDRITLHRPNDVKDIKPEEGGETEDFGIAEYNRCVIVICEKKP